MNNLKLNSSLFIFTLMLNSSYFVKKSIPRRLTLWKAWDGFGSVGFGFDRWIWMSLPPIWYNCLGNIISVENGLWWIAHKVRWVKVVWGDPVSSRKWTLTNYWFKGAKLELRRIADEDFQSLLLCIRVSSWFSLHSIRILINICPQPRRHINIKTLFRDIINQGVNQRAIVDKNLSKIT